MTRNDGDREVTVEFESGDLVRLQLWYRDRGEGRSRIPDNVSLEGIETECR